MIGVIPPTEAWELVTFWLQSAGIRHYSFWSKLFWLSRDSHGVLPWVIKAWSQVWKHDAKIESLVALFYYVTCLHCFDDEVGVVLEHPYFTQNLEDLPRVNKRVYEENRNLPIRVTDPTRTRLTIQSEKFKTHKRIQCIATSFEHIYDYNAIKYYIAVSIYI